MAIPARADKGVIVGSEGAAVDCRTMSATQKRALLERLLAERKTTVYPLSFAQARIWFLEQFEPGMSNHHIFQAMRLGVRLDYAAFERSWNAVLSRHEVLRTAFEELASSAVQIVYPEASVAIETFDLTGCREPERERTLRARAHELFERPFELSRPPLLRVAVFELGQNESALVVVMHHI